MNSNHTPVDPAEALSIVTERLTHRGVKIRYHHESWWGKLVGRIAYKCMGKEFPLVDDPTGHGWIIVQTVGNTIWIPANWDSTHPRIQFEIMLHEEAHTFQFEKCGLGSRTFGILTMGFLYLCCLPIFWTMRSRFEKAGYYQSMRARFLLGDPPGEHFLQYLIENFTTRGYVWMMGPWAKKKVEKWFWREMVRAQKDAQMV